MSDSPVIPASPPVPPVSCPVMPAKAGIHFSFRVSKRQTRELDSRLRGNDV